LENDFLEVETPILQYSSGGAAAKPFRTHYNALGADMVLRIALELPLKKLIVGGLERVFEIGRNFRNEGVSKKHNPEFSMLEFYEAYATFEDLMRRSEEIFCRIAKRVYGKLQIPFGDREIDLTPPWPRIRMQDSLYEIGGVPKSFDVGSVEGLQAIAKEYSVRLASSDWGECLDELWGELVEPKISNPVFITHHPLSISPLARKNAVDSRITDRFEIIVAGMEMGNAFSELNDAIDQRQRLEDQAQQKAAGNELANDIDEDFLFALEHGMPPTAGQGIGIDRLVMLMTGCTNIREVLLFPQLKLEVQDE
jgi:lysyl-tRNA synthetase class 2